MPSCSTLGVVLALHPSQVSRQRRLGWSGSRMDSTINRDRTSPKVWTTDGAGAGAWRPGMFPPKTPRDAVPDSARSFKETRPLLASVFRPALFAKFVLLARHSSSDGYVRPLAGRPKDISEQPMGM